MKLLYNTRDGNGNDIVREIETKELDSVNVDEYICPACRKTKSKGVPLKKLLSSNFTDWQMVGEYICPECQHMVSVYPYSYIRDDDGTRLLNVRQLRDELTKPQKPPFLFVVSTSQKKHLWYRATWNHSPERFAVQLEMETIFTTPERMQMLFDLVESLQTLGCTKDALSRGEIRFDVFQEVDHEVLNILKDELQTSREIQIPLFCGQKRESREDAIWCITSIVKAWNMQRQH